MKITRRHFKLGALTGLFNFSIGPLLGRDQQVWAELLKTADGQAAGPLVGHTTTSTAAIWMYTPGTAAAELRYATDLNDGGGRRVPFEKIDMSHLAVRGQAWKAVLRDLSPETRYEYQVLVHGEARPEHRGSFRTAPGDGKPAKFRVGVTSCMKIEKPQDSWPLFLKQEPNLHLTIGDTVYADTTDPRVQWRHHLRYRQSPAFASVIREVPTYSLWDDHDYGPDNSDGREQGKQWSLSGWQRVWLNPAAGTAQLPGAFYRFAWGDVEFFMADGRYYRSPSKANDDAGKTMLGEAQFQWLLAGLKASPAKFKIVVSGSTLHHSLHDGWRVYTHSRHQFFDAIKRHRIDGVVYVSGSLHNSLVWEHHESERVGYPLVEVISSGIANSKRLGFATLDFDTTLDDPTMTVRIVNGNGRVKRQAWQRSQLSHG